MSINLPWNCIVLRFGGCLISRTISRVIVGRDLQRFIVSTALVAIISSSPAKSNQSVKRIWFCGYLGIQIKNFPIRISSITEKQKSVNRTFTNLRRPALSLLVSSLEEESISSTLTNSSEKVNNQLKIDQDNKKLRENNSNITFVKFVRSKEFHRR